MKSNQQQKGLNLNKNQRWRRAQDPTRIYTFKTKRTLALLLTKMFSVLLLSKARPSTRSNQMQIGGFSTQTKLQRFKYKTNEVLFLS